MSAAPSTSGIVVPPVAPPTPVSAGPLPLSPTMTPPIWPRSAQLASVVLLLTVTGLLTWHVYVTQRGATRPTALDPGSLAFRVDLNRADRAQLLQLPGVGEALVQRIEDYRTSHYGFRSIEELAQIPGIGPLTIERLRHLVYVEPPEGDEEHVALLPVRAKASRTKKKEMVVPAKETGSKKETALNGMIDVNHAAADELQRLPGIGPALAGRIIETRKTAPFKTVDELRRVAGIGQKTLDKLRANVTVGTEVTKKE